MFSKYKPEQYSRLLITHRVQLLFLLGCFFLAGCQSNKLEAGWHDYLSRIANALQYDTPAANPPPGVAMPRIRHLSPPNANSQRSNIGILDFLSLDDCKLKQVIAARNSPLGKLAPSSQRLAYELNFLQYAPACINTLKRDGRDELAMELAIEFERKQVKLPLRIWQATLGGREFRELWQVPIKLGDYPESVSDDLINVLQTIQSLATQWLDGNYEIDATQFEQLLGTIRLGDAGQLHRALGTQAGMLRSANVVIGLATNQRKDVCAQAQPTSASRVFSNVVEKFWIGKMQAYAAALNRRYYSLHEAIISLEKLLTEGENTAYRSWRKQRDRDMQSWILAPRQHVEAIQLFYKRCGITI